MIYVIVILTPFLYTILNESLREGNRMALITEDMVIAQVIQINPKAVEILASYGTNCKSCPNIYKKTLKDASQKHGIDLSSLLIRLNKERE